jgi:hypothetical protein
MLVTLRKFEAIFVAHKVKHRNIFIAWSKTSLLQDGLRKLEIHRDVPDKMAVRSKFEPAVLWCSSNL